MATITNHFLPRSISIDNLINYALTTDPLFNESLSNSTPNREPQKDHEISFNSLKRKTTDYLNQPAAKKAFALNPPNSLPLENSVITSPSFKKKLRDTISQIYKKANALSLEKTQVHYANQLNIDLQEVKNIYAAVFTDCSTTNKPFRIETKTSNCSITINPELKKKLVDAIDRNLDKVKPFNLERIQTYYANQLKVDLQEIKNIYLATSTHHLTIKTSSPKELDVLDLSLKKYHVVIISPENKKNL